MSFIPTNSTNKQNAKNDLSFYHGFSKTPVEANSSGNAVTSLGNASTKAGHTVMATDVWAKEIPWYGLVPSKAVAVTRLSGLCKKNDLVKVNNDQTYIYVGAEDATFTVDTWINFWTPITLSNGTELKNRNDETVLRYYEKQVMQDLTGDNNAAIDSKGLATRLFVDETAHTGQTEGGVVVSQFAAGTDNIKNGIPSVELNPVLYVNGTQQVAGTDYYDYNVSGTILWKSSMIGKTVTISCFRYIGAVVSESLIDLDTRIDNISVQASGGIQGVSTSSKTLGFDVKWYKTVDGVENETTSDDADAKPMLVAVSATVDTNGNVTSDASYIVTASGAQSIASKAVTDATLASTTKIADTDTTNEGKLVSASQVKTYVSENAKVSVSAGEETGSDVTSIDFNGEDGADVSVTVANVVADGAATITVSAALSKATVTDGAIGTTEGNGDKVVSATDAKAIADKSARDAVNDIASDLTTHINNDNIHVTTDDKSSWNTAATKAGTAIQSVSSGNDSYVTVTSDATDATKLTVTPVLYAGTLEALSETSTGIVTPDLIKALNDKVNAHHQVPQFSVVLADSIDVTNATYVPTLDGATATKCVENTIYLVTNEAAAGGSAIEYLCYKTGTGLAVEQIGTTKVDLSAYAKTADISGSVTVTNASDVSISLAKGVLSGSISADNTVTQDSSKLVTSGAVYDAIEALSAEKGAIHTLSSTVEANKSAADTGISEAKAAAKAAQDDVDALETLVGSLPEGTTGSIVNYIVTEIGEVETRVGTLESIDHSAYATKTDLNGVDEKAKAAQTSADNRLTTIFKTDTSDDRFTIGTTEPNIVNGTQNGMKIGISLASNIATTDITTTDEEGNPVVSVEGTVYTKAEVQSYISDVLDDFAGEGSMEGGYVKTINSMECDTTGSNVVIDGQSKYFGSEIVTTDKNNKKVIINKSQSWSVDVTKKPDSTITSVINGVANDGTIIDTENLAVGTSMFSDNTALTTVCSDFSSLTNGTSMFSGCSKLETFCGDLSSLTNGEGMFNGCAKLETFCGDLSSLTNGTNMFAGCVLDVDSIGIIIDSLPTVSEGTITIGANSEITDTEIADFVKAATDKHWIATISRPAVTE